VQVVSTVKDETKNLRREEDEERGRERRKGRER